MLDTVMIRDFLVLSAFLPAPANFPGFKAVTEQEDELADSLSRIPVISAECYW